MEVSDLQEDHDIKENLAHQGTGNLGPRDLALIEGKRRQPRSGHISGTKALLLMYSKVHLWIVFFFRPNLWWARLYLEANTPACQVPEAIKKMVNPEEKLYSGFKERCNED